MRIFGWVDDRKAPTLITFWSIVHAISGIVAYSIYTRSLEDRFSLMAALGIWFVIHALYETKDYLLTYTYLKQVFGIVDENTWQNSIADQAIAMAGFLVASVLGWKNVFMHMAFLAGVLGLIVIGSLSGRFMAD